MKQFFKNEASRFSFIGFLFCMIILLSSCQKEVSLPSANSGEEINSLSARKNPVMTMYSGLDEVVLNQLKQARSATAKYQDIANALEDGYGDAHAVVPNMGHHYLNLELLLDNEFDLNKPEILVYNKMTDGKMKLVALEYASLLSNPSPPEGFTGEGDVWDPVPGPGIWGLHAWVWEYNPAGVFNPTNANVIVMH